MTSFDWTNGLTRLAQEDARRIPLDDESVHCVVTSPPYFGLRDYRVPDGIGLEPTFDEYIDSLVLAFDEVHRVLRNDGTLWLNLGDIYSGGGRGDPGPNAKNSDNMADAWDRVSRRSAPIIRGKRIRQESSVGRWGGGDRQVDGLPTKNVVGLPWRVAFTLQEMGWILRAPIVWHKDNPMPESSPDRPTSAFEMVFLFSKTNMPQFWTHRDLPGTRTRPKPDFRWVNRFTGDELDRKPDGWHRGVECPEAVETVHELSGYRIVERCDLCKTWMRINMWTGHDYYYDGESLRTPFKPQTIARLTQPTFDLQTGGPKDPGAGNRSHRRVTENLHRKMTRHVPAGWGQSESYEGQDPRYPKRNRQRGHSRQHAGFNDNWDNMSKEEQSSFGANLRNVWLIPTQPYPGAHFATYPEELVRRCLLLGTTEHGVCSGCGSPWTRATETTYDNPGNRTTNGPRSMERRHETAGFPQRLEKSTTTKGWRPTCDCDVDSEPARVLDPFVGSGTTSFVAQGLGRRSYGYDLNLEYLETAVDRVSKISLPLV